MSSQRATQVVREVFTYERMLLAILVFNVLDAVFTYFWVKAGFATEANPLMARLLDQSSIGFFVIKLAGVTAGVYWLMSQSAHRLARLGVVPVFCLYGFVCAGHFAASVTALARVPIIVAIR